MRHRAKDRASGSPSEGVRMPGKGFGFKLSPSGGGFLPPSSASSPFSLTPPSALNLANPFGPYSPQEYADGEAELKLLKQFFGYFLDAKKHPYITQGHQVGDIYHVVKYMA